jgi:hypothetical protein
MNKYLLMLLILSSGNVFAFTSKWIDEEGKVHYSDQLPPFHAKSKLILNTDMPEAPPTNPRQTLMRRKKLRRIRPHKRQRTKHSSKQTA